MVPGTRRKGGFSAHLAVQMLRKRLKAAEAAGGPEIVVGFFKKANKDMADRQKAEKKLGSSYHSSLTEKHQQENGTPPPLVETPRPPKRGRGGGDRAEEDEEYIIE
jgi:hypothetical protein